MTRTVIGLFDTIGEAQNVVQSLLDGGLSRDNISLITQNSEGIAANAHEVGGDSAADGAGAGAVGGTVVGGVLGLLVGAGLLAIPGIGPVLAAGPIAAAIGSASAAIGAAALGAGVGAATGGLMGGLVSAGVSEDDARYYTEGVRRGGTLVSVTADDADADRASDIMRRMGAVDIERRRAEWHSQGWDDQAGDYASDKAAGTRSETTAEWRDSSKVGTAGGTLAGAATGAAIGAAGGPVGAVIGGVAGAATGAATGAAGDVAGEKAQDSGAVDDTTKTYRDTSGTGSDFARGMRDQVGSGAGSDFARGMHTSGPRNYNDYESDFRNHYQGTTSMRGRTYDDYAPAYRYGYSLASGPNATGGSWEEIEANARRDWERDYPNSWEEFKSSVRYAWEQARGRS
jgi:hypothetical protein